ncbi:salicylate hydroxylase [Chaetomidium leptoderma]|uniref:Salicylate hydroxylase n=1 Tax=Chaetomidium leptoderma TaxID=669021 RepID=A0AAN6ZXY7_9PEZI|nr:salicylate hydroxylase [Chaetomidium leptoderma]
MACAGAQNDTEPLHIAIIGAGITGVNVALGLQARNVSFTIYERASGFREIGAGMGFSPNAERAMAALNPDVLAGFKKVANPNGEDYFQWVDGHKTGELIFKLHVGKSGFQGGRRSDILEEWAKLIPPTTIHFNKEIDTISDDDSHPSTAKQPLLLLHFKDGTTATADAVIGCDGIRSRVRRLILSPPSSSSSPSSSSESAFSAGYTGKFCFRALALMPDAIAALGPYKATTRFMYNGPGGHVITYPVANNTLLNILAVLSDPDPVWPHGPHRHTAPGRKEEAVAAFEGWHATVRGIVDLLPDDDGGPGEEVMEKWALFDMADHPAPGYVKGRVCVAGDAAHAAGPHLGAGGGMGIEDALVLAALLADVAGRVGGGSGEQPAKGVLVKAALEVYNEVRYGRTQDVVQSTRAACDLFHWADPAVGRDPERFGREITARFFRVWEYDVEGMVEEALARLDARVS